MKDQHTKELHEELPTAAAVEAAAQTLMDNCETGLIKEAMLVAIRTLSLTVFTLQLLKEEMSPAERNSIISAMSDGTKKSMSAILGIMTNGDIALMKEAMANGHKAKSEITGVESGIELHNCSDCEHSDCPANSKGAVDMTAPAPPAMTPKMMFSAAKGGNC